MLEWIGEFILLSAPKKIMMILSEALQDLFEEPGSLIGRI